jgi:polyisoprenoid-binding protein YceI
VALRAGSQQVGPDDGTLELRTYREGVAQKVGHDLIIDVGSWQATVDVGDDGTVAAVGLEADPRSLAIREGRRGLKPLSDRDRREILKNIDEKILHGEPIAFGSSDVEHADGRLTVGGDLTMAGATRPARFELDVAADGTVTGALPVTQSDWGIKPYRGLMGALKVRDSMEVVFDVRLPAD